MKHPVKHLRFPKAAVETVAELRQVTRQMLGTDAMMDTPDIAFNRDYAAALTTPVQKTVFRTSLPRADQASKVKW
jgi:hypothetical protein